MRSHVGTALGYLLGLALASLVCIPVGVAQTPEIDPEDAARAGELYERGRAAVDAGDVETAIDAIEEAFSIVQDPAFAYNLGLLYEHEGEPARAFRFFRQYLRLYPEAPNRAEVEERLLDLEDTLARTHAAVSITSVPDGATIFQMHDGVRRDVGQTPVLRYYPPGPVEFNVRKPGFRPATLEINAVGGRLHEESVELEPITIDVATSDGPSEADIELEKPAIRLATVGVIVLGAGAAAAGTGVTFLFLSGSDRSEADDLREQRDPASPDPALEREIDELDDRADTRKLTGMTLGAIGIGAILGGAALILFDEARGTDRAALVPEVGPGYAGVRARFAF